MHKVIIYKGSKTPTQSGKSKSKFWYLKFDKDIFYEEDFMTGWKGNTAPTNNIKIRFSTLERAVAYAEKKNYEYQVLNESKKKIKVKSYADNFKFNRNKSDID
tara:strand:+ start:85 stop:393 length:309 start_codon:yes stop_codon:yes gene_type:complete